MNRFRDVKDCLRKADQEWDMAGLARQDVDMKAAKEHTDKARVWLERAREGGYEGPE